MAYRPRLCEQAAAVRSIGVGLVLFLFAVLSLASAVSHAETPRLVEDPLDQEDIKEQWFGGEWRAEGQRGPIRIVLAKRGHEHRYTDLFIQWLVRQGGAAETAPYLARKTVTVEEAHFWLLSIKQAKATKQGAVITLAGYHTMIPADLTFFRLTVGKPNSYTFVEQEEQWPKQWLQNKAIIAISKLVSAMEQQRAQGVYHKKERHTRFGNKVLYLDNRGRPRIYISSDFFHYYDTHGVLRFATITTDLDYGTRVEVRYYYDENGKRIVRLKRKIKGPGYDYSVLDDDIVQDPLDDFPLD